MKFATRWSTAAILLALTWSSASHAIGYVYMGVGGGGRQLMELTSVEVDVQIQDRVAVTRLDQIFTNHSANQVEGIYEFVLPQGAIITDLVLWIGDKRVQGIIMEKEEARQVYDEIVGRNIDPALIEDLGEGLFRLSIFPFPPQGSRRVELEYTQILDGRDGILHYRFPLAAEGGQAALMQRFELRAQVRSQLPFEAAVEGLFGQITAIEQSDPLNAQVLFADEQVLAERDFELICTETGEQGLPRVLSYAPGDGQMGYYALWLPPLELDETEPLPRSITFIIDVSTSMQGRLPPVRSALISSIEALDGDDLFNIISYSSSATAFVVDPIEASLDNKTAAIDFVRGLTPLGSTNFDSALRLALGQAFPAGRINHLIFLTDGHPTRGEEDLTILSRLVERLGGGQVRVFTIGVGEGVNRSFLRALAEDNRGKSHFVSTEEDIDSELRALFDEFTRPTFLPTRLVLEGTQVYDVFPLGVDLLAAGQELFQVGRYPTGGPFTLRLEGRILGGREQDETLALDYPLAFSQEVRDQPLIPRLWGRQKVQELEAEIARVGLQRELLDDILDLGLTYRLVTRRTSLFAPDENVVINPELQEDDSGGDVDATAVEEALVTASWHGKTFLLRDQIWVDAQFDADMPLVKYDPAANQPPQLEAFAQLQKDLIVVWQGTAYALGQSRHPMLPSLQQNYPNPFNSGTVISYSLPSKAEIRLAVYNLSGQQIATLAEGMQLAAHAIHWDGRDDQGRQLASGIYLYRLFSGTQIESRKLLLLR